MVYVCGFVVILFLILFFLKFKRARKVLISVILPPVDLEVVKQGEIKVLTYNVAGLPQRISAARTPRRVSMGAIGKLLNAYDIVNLQEDFNYNSFLVFTALHPYKTSHKGKVPFGDGLSTLSKFPIVEYQRITWKSCHGSDCLTPKGFTYVQIQLASHVFLDVYNVHATAHDSIRSAAARRQNLDQLAQYIHNHSLERPLLVMGDFNAHYANGLDNISDFLQKTSLADVWVDLVNDGKFPAIDPQFVARDMLSLTNQTESLDKVLYRNSTHLKLTPACYDISSEAFRDENNLPLSDHLAVAVSLKWEWLGEED